MDDFTYIGTNINNTGSCEVQGAYWYGQKRSIPIRDNLEKLRYFLEQSTIFIYCLETWILKADRDRIDVFEMWFWRKIM